MIGQKRILMGVLGAIFIAGCDGSQTKTSPSDQTELTQLREEKKTWESEKAKLQASLDLAAKEKSERISELVKIKDELKACQDKQASLSETKPEAKDQKTGTEKLLKK